MKYKAVLFDMDGTVLDTLGDIADAVNHSLETFGYPRQSEDVIRAKLGNGARMLMTGCAPENLSSEAFEELLNFYNSYYNDHSIIRTAPYAGIPELCAELEAVGCKVAIISNKPDPTVKGLADRFFHGMYAVGECPDIRRKPAPDAVLTALKEFNIRPDEAVYIGDTEVDVQTARNAGTGCIAVSWGFRSLEQLQDTGVSDICATVEELSGKLLTE